MNSELIDKAKNYVETFCSKITNRAVGRAGNIAATDFFRKTVTSFGWITRADELDVTDWNNGIAEITVDSEVITANASPYSNGCSVKAELVCVSDVEALESKNIFGKIVLLYGEIAAEQLMPKNFVFYNPEEHIRIISLLEKGMPSCIICATGRNSALAGGAYPFALIEDGDFDIPSVYIKDIDGLKLEKNKGKIISVTSTALRIASKAFNVSAVKNSGKKRLIITAHIDAKDGTPGAIDNATGVAVLMLLAEMLSEYNGKYTIELIAFNGEDYYAVPGQMDFIRRNDGLFGTMALNINIDGLGYKDGNTAYSFCELPEDLEKSFMDIIRNSENAQTGAWWPQGDHSIFAQFGVPAVAVTSMWFIDNMSNQAITHTAADNPGIVNYERVTGAALIIYDFIRKIS